METFLDHAVALAFTEAQNAAVRGEIPVGAAVFDAHNGTVVAVASNRVETDTDPTAHAEILALRQACHAKKTTYLTDCDMYVTLEPCAMCAAAISFARIRRLYFGAYDVKSGGVEHGATVYKTTSCHYIPDVYGGISETKAADLLKTFFKTLRKDTDI